MRAPSPDHDLQRLVDRFTREMRPSDPIERAKIERHALRLIRSAIMLTAFKGPEEALRELDDRQ